MQELVCVHCPAPRWPHHIVGNIWFWVQELFFSHIFDQSYSKFTRISPSPEMLAICSNLWVLIYNLGWSILFPDSAPCVHWQCGFRWPLACLAEWQQPQPKMNAKPANHPFTGFWFGMQPREHLEWMSSANGQKHNLINFLNDFCLNLVVVLLWQYQVMLSSLA